jgi:hypothetical protein
MPLKRIGDPGPDLLESCRRLRKECLEIHLTPPSATGSGATFRIRRWATSDVIVGARMVNAALTPQPQRE